MPSAGQPRLPPAPHSTSFLHTPSPWSCSAASRLPAHLFTWGCCDVDPRHLNFDQLQLLRPLPGQPLPPLDSQPARSSPAHQLLTCGSTGRKGTYMDCKTSSRSISHLLNCSRCSSEPPAPPSYSPHGGPPASNQPPQAPRSLASSTPPAPGAAARQAGCPPTCSPVAAAMRTPGTSASASSSL